MAYSDGLQQRRLISVHSGSDGLQQRRLISVHSGSDGLQQRRLISVHSGSDDLQQRRLNRGVPRRPRHRLGPGDVLHPAQTGGVVWGGLPSFLALRLDPLHCHHHGDGASSAQRRTEHPQKQGQVTDLQLGEGVAGQDVLVFGQLRLYTEFWRQAIFCGNVTAFRV